MKETRGKKAILSMAAQLVLILSWLNSIAGSDSYFYVYALVALIGALCLQENSRRSQSLSRQELLWASVPAAVFSVAVVLANYLLFEPLYSLMNLLNVTLALLGGWVIGVNILTYMAQNLPLAPKITSDRSKNVRKIFFISFSAIVCIDMAFLLLVEYPAVITADSMNQLGQILSGQYDNRNPYWHTQTIGLFVRLGTALFGNPEAGVALFTTAQILFIAGCISYTVVTLYQKGLPLWAVATIWSLYALLPYQISYSVTIWKDILFSISSLLMITSLYRLISPINQRLRRDWILFALSSLGLCLWRTNGLLAYGISFAAVAVSCRRDRKLLSVMAVVLVCALILCGPMLSIMEIEGSDYVELLSIPLQQVARVVQSGAYIEPGDLEMIRSIAEPEQIAAVYSHEISDPIKSLVRYSSGSILIQENPLDYFMLWVRLGLNNPGEYLKAWVEQTKGYWNGGYPYWIIASGVIENELGFASHQVPVVAKLFYLINRYFELADLTHPFISIGLHVWILLFCCAVLRRRKNLGWILTIPSFSIIFGLIIGTPVFSEFRYAYPIMLATPLVLALTIFDGAPKSEP